MACGNSFARKTATSACDREALGRSVHAPAQRRPSEVALLTAEDRDVTPSFIYVWRRWVFTVLRERCSSDAMSTRSTVEVGSEHAYFSVGERVGQSGHWGRAWRAYGFEPAAMRAPACRCGVGGRAGDQVVDELRGGVQDGLDEAVAVGDDESPLPVEVPRVSLARLRCWPAAAAVPDRNGLCSLHRAWHAGNRRLLEGSQRRGQWWRR